MKKIYKTDAATRMLLALFNCFLLVGTIYILLFDKTSKPTYKIFSLAAFSFMCIWWYIDLLFFEVIIEDDRITTKIRFFSFLNKYRSVYWQNIQILEARGGFFFEETGNITLFPKDIRKWHVPQIISIPIGFGISQYILKDILPHLPKDATVKIEPFLMKYIEGEPKVYSKTKLVAIGIGLILLVVGGFWLSWYLAFHNPWVK